ncbi:MAG: iron ABC transporter permease [Alphaproteobacteria bacterium]|nr:iron ABC transporter permease [Alphaproteobacteria bacterium]
MRARDGALLAGLAALVVVLFVVSLRQGTSGPSLLASVAALFSEESSIEALILREIRLPRAILAVLAGAALGLAGAALQGLLRNPLADPGVLGVSATAGLGSVIALYFGLAQVSALALSVGGMLGALLSVIFLALLAGRDASVTTLVLAGVAINTMATAITALALNLAPSQYAALEIVFWLLGSLADRSFDHIVGALPLLLGGWLLLVGTGRGLDALTLGEDAAQSLGINLPLLRWRIVVGVALSVGAIVSVTGGIGFVGLVVPHLLRPLIGHEPRRLLRSSALAGAALLLAGDVISRQIPTDQPLQIGVVTALVGAPFFLYLIIATRRVVP